MAVVQGSASGGITVRARRRGPVTNQLTSTVTVSGSAWAIVTPAPTPIPDSVVPYRRVSAVWPTPILDGLDRPSPNEQPLSVVEEDWGYLDVRVDNRNVTYWRNIPAVIEEISWAEPFGPQSATIRVPATTGFADALPLNRPYAPVTIRRRRSAADPGTPIWSGWVQVVEDVVVDNEAFVRLECIGRLYKANNYIDIPKPRRQDPRDIGWQIADMLYMRGQRSGPHWPPPAPVVTGIMTTAYGRYERVLDAISEMLDRATTSDGNNQWTIMIDDGPEQKPIIRLKDRSTVHHRVRFGAPGVEVQVSRDYAQEITTVYGQGIAPDGCRWRNAKYPRSTVQNPPPYPGYVIGPWGTAAALGRWKAQARDVLRIPFTNTDPIYHGNEEQLVRAAQRAMGLQVDGLIGPQTWEALFQRAAADIDLDSAFIMPLAGRIEAIRTIHNASGGVVGPNPWHDPVRVPRREVFVDYGRGVGFWEGVRFADARVARDGREAWAGTITLTADPESTSRFDIRAGHNIQVKAHRGTNRLFHISEVRCDPQTGTVTLTVDTGARDLLALEEILERKRDATGPARRGLAKYGARRSLVVDDDPAAWDCEAGAGLIPRTALYRGLWLVLRVPFAEFERIVETRLKLESPSRMAVGVWGNEIRPSDLASLPINHPLMEGFWEQLAGTPLDPWMAWGGEGEAAGYGHGRESRGDTVTGELVWTTAWDFRSDAPPWAWVGIWAENPNNPTNWIEGYFRAEPF